MRQRQAYEQAQQKARAQAQQAESRKTAEGPGPAVAALCPSRLRRDPPALVGAHDRLDPVAQTELAEQARDVGFSYDPLEGVVFFIVPAAWAAGRALREREHVVAQLAERAREIEQEHEAHARLTVRYERARIASELHDIVAHAITVMVVQASAGQRLAAHDPQLTTEAFEVIAETAHQAEQEMGHLVALLGHDAALVPAPDLALVEQLVARASASGLDVTLRLEDDRDGLPAPLVQAACRVVQEGLTNAMRYAAGAAVTVLVRGEPGALVTEVRNAAPVAGPAREASGTGNGLRGLRELVGACAGPPDRAQPLGQLEGRSGPSTCAVVSGSACRPTSFQQILAPPGHQHG